MNWTSFIICLVIVLLLAIYCFLKRSYTYWKRRGVPYVEPEFLWGNAKTFLKKEISIGDMLTEFYNEFKLRGVIGGGMYLSVHPIFIPVDLELIKNIVQKDFDHFVNHGFYVNEEDDPLSGHLFSLEDERWKYLRAKLTPTFTSGKLKMMFQTMAACAEGLKDVLNQHVLLQDPVEIKEVVSRFSTDIIASCAFGIECNTLKNPSSEFREYGKKIFEPDTIFEKLKGMIFFFVSHKLLKALHAKHTHEGVEKFFMGVVKDTVDYREKNNVHRNDFMQLLLQLKNQGRLSDDKSEMRNDGSDSDKRLTFNEVAAQCYIFYLAGFETSASTMTFALLELAINQDIQDKLRQEILEVLEKHEGKISYDAIMEMSYLNKVVHETLRKHPPFASVPRICNKAYKIPGTDITLQRGTMIQIPIQSVQRDPEYYPDPEKFDPERFNEENKSQRNPYTFLAFGEGPRYCIGARFGLLQAKVGIVNIIKNFKVTLNNKTKTPIKYVSKYIVTTVDGDVWLNVSQIK